jgi:hypothetical protein
LPAAFTYIEEANDWNASFALALAGGTMTGSIVYGTNRARFGAANEFDIYLAGAIALITAEIGDVWIRNTSTDGVIQLQSDNGSGGNANYVTCDGSTGEVQLKHYGVEKLATKAGGVDITGDMTFGDNDKANFGAGSDLQIFHDGSNSYIVDNGTGDLFLRASSNIYLQSAGGTKYLDATASGDVNLYYANALKISTTATGVSVIGGVDITGNLGLPDNGVINIGAGDDLTLQHNGTNTFIDNNTGLLLIRSQATDEFVRILADDGAGGVTRYFEADGSTGAAAMYHYGVTKLTTAAGGVDITGDLSLPDSGMVNLGTGDDLQLYHNGSDSFIDNNVGRLILRNYTNNEGILLQADDGAGGLASYVFADGATGEVSIRHYGAIKLTTKADGVDITGILRATRDSAQSLSLNRTGTDGAVTVFQNDGVLVGTISVTAAATAYNTSSDYRLKENIVPIQGAADIVKAMKPCTYTFKADGSWADGFIAHEMQELHPQAVTGTKDAMRDEEYQVSPALGVVFTAAVEEVTAEVPVKETVESSYVNLAGETVIETKEQDAFDEVIETVVKRQDIEGVLTEVEVEIVRQVPIMETIITTKAVAEIVHGVDVERPADLEGGQQWRKTTEAVMATRSVPDHQGVDYSKLTPILTAALKEALDKIDDLQTRLAALEAV